LRALAEKEQGDACADKSKKGLGSPTALARDPL